MNPSKNEPIARSSLPTTMNDIRSDAATPRRPFHHGWHDRPTALERRDHPLSRGGAQATGAGAGSRIAGIASASAALCQYEERVSEDPDAVAVVSGELSLTYRQLDRRANRLARVLRRSGVDPRATVCVLLPQCADFVVACLAVLKAGARCVPVDPVDALANQGIVAGLRASALVTSHSAASDGPLSPRPPLVVHLDLLESTLARTSPEPLGAPVAPGDVALIALAERGRLEPAVPLTHFAMSNLLRRLTGRLALGAGDRVLGTDVTTARGLMLEVLLPLTSGATVVLAPQGRTARVDSVPRLIRDGDITLVHMWGEASRNFWRAVSSHRGKRLRVLSSSPFVNRLPSPGKLPPSVELWSYYGHREAAFCSTLVRLSDDAEPGALGRAMVGVRLHLLDDQLRPVPTGETGRIYIGGPSVARGYLGGQLAPDPRFLPDPFGTEGRGALFRTDDFAARREDGSIALIDPEDARCASR